MDAQQAIDLTREAITTALWLGAPLLAVALLAAVLVGLIQALFQMHDPTISFVPKLVATAVAIALCLPWLLERLIEYSHVVITHIPQTLAGG
jgi:flagellar biosynthetic protein FliQ